MTTREGQIVLGINNSPADELALQWAAAEASTLKHPLRVVCAYSGAAAYGTGPLAGRVPAYNYGDSANLRTVATEAVSAALTRIAELAPTVEASGEAIDGAAAPVLIAESTHASVLVLGSHQRGRIGSLLGSVSAAVAARANCPTVVLRGPQGLEAENPAVVVGVSRHDLEATQTLLDFGFRYASEHRAPLRAVMCWHPDPLATMDWRIQAPPPAEVDAWLAEAVAGWREKYPDVDTHTATISEHPTAGLVGESLNQRLLVVGTRGQHALAGTLLGSVSQGVLHHALCPVAVVPTHGG